MMVNTSSSRPERIAAIDALRGFDMFWITGGLPLFLAASRLVADPLPQWLVYHTRHCPWEGFAAWDLIMPLFMFIVGAAMPFSFARYSEGHRNYTSVYGRILKRVFLLFLLGMVAQGNLLSFEVKKINLFCNTLQAIAGGYLISSITLLHMNLKGRILTLAGLLISYWAILRFVPFGGHPGGTIEPRLNVALYWDELLQGKLQDGTNYTWIISQLAFGAMTLCGVLGGEILKSRLSQLNKVWLLAGAGVLSLLLGYLWSFDLEIIKHIYSSSMVLWAAGWCFLLLAVFYVMADILRWEKLLFPFRVIGCNAIFVYMWVNVCPPEKNLSVALFGGFSHLWGPARPFVFLLCNYLFIWGILYFLYKRKIFIKI